MSNTQSDLQKKQEWAERYASNAINTAMTQPETLPTYPTTDNESFNQANESYELRKNQWQHIVNTQGTSSPMYWQFRGLCLGANSVLSVWYSDILISDTKHPLETVKSVLPATGTTKEATPL